MFNSFKMYPIYENELRSFLKNMRREGWKLVQLDVVNYFWTNGPEYAIVLEQG